MIGWFFRIGEFSLINDAVGTALRKRFPELEWREVDVERDIVRASPALFLRASAESTIRYGSRILGERRPPRDFFPRVPVVIDAVRSWVRENIDPANTAFVFQTQSLFDARHPDRPHFLYTDHTYLANLRYPEPRPLLPVPPRWREMESDLYRDATCNFVSSAFATESIREDYGVGSDRVLCVHSGSNVSLVEPLARTGNVVLFVGVDWERKGGPELIRAFQKVRREMPSAELWIVGCTPAIKEDGVRVFGRIPAEQVAKCYAEADVFCLPSRMDPSASVLAEAAGAKLPIVATPVGGNVERVIEGETGFLVEPDALDSALLKLLADAGLRKNFGEAGRRLVLEQFTWDAVCDKMAARMRAER